MNQYAQDDHDPAVTQGTLPSLNVQVTAQTPQLMQVTIAGTQVTMVNPQYVKDLELRMQHMNNQHVQLLDRVQRMQQQMTQLQKSLQMMEARRNTDSWGQ